MSSLPGNCPSCGEGMTATVVVCGACGVEVSGEFVPCPVCRLGARDRELLDLFLSSRGNLKRMERRLAVSYPTVRQRVDDLLTRMGYLKTEPPNRLEILRRLREGEITVDEAERLLRG